MVKVSVIIPCYNQGHYLKDAVNSVLSSTFRDYEIIIVNDGSTDDSAKYIDALDYPNVIKINQPNQGVSQARNNAILRASGQYILPLDADDKISASYIESAVNSLEQDKDLVIVYCDAEFFGDKQGKWNLPKFSMKCMLRSNMIFVSAFFRKEDWEKVNGYDEAMESGLEDWEFWISILSLGRKTYRIPAVHFYYRQHDECRTVKLKAQDEQFQQLHTKVYLKHQAFYAKYGCGSIEVLYNAMNWKKRSGRRILKFLTKAIPYKPLKKWIRTEFWL